MNPAGWAVRHPLGTLLLSLAVVVVGVLGFREMRLGLMPQIVYPLVKVRVEWPGTPPDVMELMVTRPLEQELARTEGAVLVQSTTEQGTADVTLSFNHGTDVDKALRDASARLDFASGRLPKDVPPPLIWKLDPADTPVLQIALGSSVTDEVELRRWAEYELGPQLTGVPGVAAVQVAGGREREVQVAVDVGRLAGYDLTLADIAGVLRNENRMESAGRTDQGRVERLTRTSAGFRSVDAINTVSVPGRPGRAVQLDDIARVRDTTKEQRLYVRFNGEPAVLVSILQNPSANTVDTVEGVQKRLRSLREQGFIPADVQAGVVSDESFYIRGTVSSLQEHLIEGAVLAVVVLLLFLGNLRATVCVIAVFPVAILGTLAVMRYGGMTLNLMSLGGIIIGLGVMIDSAIVVMENIDRHRRGGLDPAAAGVTAAREVTGSLVAATMAMLVSVFPFLTISSLALLFYREMIVVIAVAFAISLVASLTVVPSLAARLYRRPAPPSRFWGFVERLYAAGLAACLRVAPASVVGVVVAVFAGVLLFQQMGNIFLPEVDDGRAEVRVLMPTGSSLEENVRATRQVEELIRSMPHVQNVLVTTGGRISTAVSYDASQTEMAIQLVPRSERDQSVRQWIAAVRAKLAESPMPEVRQVRVDKARIRSIRTFSGGVGREGVTDIQLNIQGQDPAALNTAAARIQDAIRDVPGLEGVRSTAPPSLTELTFDLDPVRAAALGVEAESVAKLLKIAIAGEVPTRYLESPYFHDVRLWADRGQLGGDAENLLLLSVPTRDGGRVPLGSVATIRRRATPLFVERENQLPVVQVTGSVSGDRTLGDVAADINQRLAGVELPKGVRVQFGGNVATLGESQGPLVGAMLLALFLRVIVLGVQFESLLNPALVMLTVLPALVGSLLALDLAGVPMSSTVYVGLLLAAGIVESNSIIMVEFIEQTRHGGRPLREAILEAAPHRLRPILMTAVVGVAALAPLAMGSGDGSELLQPMALAVIGGLVAATLFTLVFLPCFYLMAHGAKDMVVRRFGVTAPSEPTSSPLPGVEPASREA